jgi:hypothetical protein
MHIEYDGTLQMQVISILFPTSTTQDLRSLAPVTPYGQYKSAYHRGGLVAALPEFHDSRSMLEEKGSLVPKDQNMLAWCLLLLLLWHRPSMKNAEKQA